MGVIVVMHITTNGHICTNLKDDERLMTYVVLSLPIGCFEGYSIILRGAFGEVGDT